MKISEAASKLFDLFDKLGIKNIKDRDGAFMFDVDEHWKVGVNGHRETVQSPKAKDFMHCDIEPFCIAVWYNGWLAGFLSPPIFDGAFADGEGANEDTFIEALDRRLEQAVMQ